MISPSSSRTIRSTPCVEGCDGPMFRTIFSPWTSCSSSLSNGDSRHVWNFARLARERKIFAQRKIGIAFPHQNAAQVGVTAKANTHHVVDFALVPIGRFPHGRDCGQLGLFLAHVGFQTQMAVMPVA